MRYIYIYTLTIQDPSARATASAGMWLSQDHEGLDAISCCRAERLCARSLERGSHKHVTHSQHFC